MAETIKDKLEAGPMFDMIISEHRFAPYMRDYDVIVDITSASSKGGSYVSERYLYRFTHCALVEVTTRVEASWDDVFTDYNIWKEADSPDGFVWGACYQNAYPGLEYIENSELAKQWATKLEKTMHEVTIETECQKFRLIFHDVIIEAIAVGNSENQELRAIEEQ